MRLPYTAAMMTDGGGPQAEPTSTTTQTTEKPPAAAPIKIIVKRGDTLSGIAKANGTTVEQILANNPTLAARSKAGKTVLFNGTTVKIPAPVAPPSTTDNTSGTGGNDAGTGDGTGTDTNTGTWTKAGTVQTASGPVDVDAKGIAQDGSTPIAVTGDTKETPTLVDTITDDYGNKIGVYSDGSKKTSR